VWLFFGGEGCLVFIDFDDMLVIGIEVEVCLFGKKVKWFLLFLGGERLLIVVVLFVVIFKVWFSLFYVMDEVEVVLDDINLGCLIVIMEELCEFS